MKVKKIVNGLKYLSLGMCVFALSMIIRVHADNPVIDVSQNNDCTLDIIDNGVRGDERELQVNVNNISPGKRITGFKYCLTENDCDDEGNWVGITKDNDNKDMTAFSIAVGNNDYSFWFNVPDGNLILVATFADFEPMNISYARFLRSTDDESEYRDIYSDAAKERENYESEFTDIVTGYRGGDIVLPHGCTDNGCLLKVSMNKTDYNTINARLDEYNSDNTHERNEFLDLSRMFNHLSDYNMAADTLEAMTDNDNNLVIEDENNVITFYLIVNKFFYENNRSNFTVGDNRNRILSEDYLGLNYKVDRKYFDEGNMYGFLTFNEFNNYEQEAVLFYGTPIVKFAVDGFKEPALADGGSAAGMGTLKHVYNKIVSADPDKYPINQNFELTINSFYNPDYTLSLNLMNDSTLVKKVTLNISRFAFGEILIVNNDGVNCRDRRYNANCNDNNANISTEYRGLYDTFYSNGETLEIGEENNANLKTFEISRQQNGVEGRTLRNETVYVRNEDFNPWAVAIFYHNDEVVTTKSFNLGELTKIEGYSLEAIPNSEVNNIARDNGELITDYDSSNYNVFGYGLGYEIPINKIKYFSRGSYEGGNLNYTLILASKKEIEDNNINRIALFLTNGELKADEANFPKLTYGVGEGKIFEIDDRTFDRLGGE